MRKGRIINNYYLDYWEVHPSEVSDEGWAFAYHLHELYRRWVYLRRVLRIVRLVNPQTGKLDVLFNAVLESEEWATYPDERWVRSISDEFFNDTCYLLTALAHCLADLAPKAFAERLEIWATDLSDEEVEELRSYGQMATTNHDDASWQIGFLFNVNIAHSAVCTWEERLRQLRAEDFHQIWKQARVWRGARTGGEKSGKTKVMNQQASPDKVREHYEKLLAQGHPERSIAAILAKRLDVTSDHVRRVRRHLKDKPTRRP